ncbi:MAG: BT_3928 family protein [Bacteroidota bacterium]
MKTIANICRFIVGPLFIFSGWIKANDPLGFSYKLDEYFDVFHTPIFKEISVFLATSICVFEIGLGVVVIVGYRMKLFSWLLFLLIVFFSFLTFYSAWFDVVKDCGCFGDFMHLTPWNSFSKDVALFFLTGAILLQRNKIKPMFTEKPGMMITVAGFVISAAYSIYCIRHLPVVDLRPYKIGTNLLDAMKLPPNAVKDSSVVTYQYKNLKTGEVKMYDSKSIPWQDSTWDLVKGSQKVKVIREGTKPAIHDFALTDMLGGDVNDHDSLYTHAFLTDPKYSFFLISYNLTKSDKDKELMKKINDFYDATRKDSLSFIGLTATGPKDIDAYKHENNALYDFYNCDETALKTFIRSAPGLVLLKQGTVLAMWHHNDFPTYAEVKAKYFK